MAPMRQNSATMVSVERNHPESTCVVAGARGGPPVDVRAWEAFAAFAAFAPPTLPTFLGVASLRCCAMRRSHLPTIVAPTGRLRDAQCAPGMARGIVARLSHGQQAAQGLWWRRR